jgi:hypothetical protein
MPLTGSASVLSAALKSARLAANPDAEVVDNAALTADCDAIATTVIAHIIANAVVTPGITLIAPGGLTPAPVTGVGTIT